MAKTAEQLEIQRLASARYRVRHAEEIAARRAADHEQRKAKERAASARWRDAHPDRLKTTQDRYYAVHHDEVLARKAAHHAANGDLIRARKRARYAANPEAALARVAAYRTEHSEASRIYQARYRREHPEVDRATQKTRRARKHGVTADLTRAQWEALKVLHGHRCVYCGIKPRQLTQDHIVPLSRGGHHTLRNIVPSCKPCNSRKYVGPPLVPVQPALLV